MKKRILILTAILAIAVFSFGQPPSSGHSHDDSLYYSATGHWPNEAIVDHSALTDSSSRVSIIKNTAGDFHFYGVVDSAIPGSWPPSKTSLVIITGHDTVTIRDTLNIPTVGPIVPSDHIGPIPIPSWLQIALIVLATIVFTVLPAIQAVLKVIPTPWSIRIGGWIGKILDWATWFIKDTSTTIGVFHK